MEVVLVQMANLAIKRPIDDWIDVNAEYNEQGYPESMRLCCGQAHYRAHSYISV